MYRHFYLGIIGIVLFFTLSFCALFVLKNTKAKNENNKSTSHSAVAIYKNNEYGFTIKHPQRIVAEKTFAPFHDVGTSWKMYGDEGGVEVVEFPIHKIENMTTETGGAYPLYFLSAVRIGVSDDVAGCYKNNEVYGDIKPVTVEINGILFKKFTFSESKMKSYLDAESYRTIYNNKCYVLERLKTGSRYMDENMARGTPEELLNKYYDDGSSIIKSFNFTR